MNKLRERLTKDRLSAMLSPVVVILLAMLFISILLLSVGSSPLAVFASLVRGAFGSKAAIIGTIGKSVPICFSALAVGLAKKAGVFNIGVEGQLVFGALGASFAGIYLTGLPAIIHVPLSLLCGVLFGMLYALGPGLMFLKRQVNLLVIFILMNNIVKKLTTFFVVTVINDPTAMTTSSLRIQDSAKLPILLRTPARLNIGFLILIAVGVLIYLFLYKTTQGYEMRACGLNREAAAYAGIPTKKYILFSLLAGGALAGLAGGIEVLGTYYRLYDGFSPGYGFDGIPIALLADGNPIGILIGSVLFGALRAGSNSMQVEMGVSSEIVSVLQGMLVTLIACEYIVRFACGKLLAGRKKKAAHAAAGGNGGQA